MELTLHSYLSNPYGKGNSTMPGLQGMKDQYKTKLAEISDKVSLTWFLYKKTALIAKILIPSGSANGIFYDVVLEFDISAKVDNPKTIMDYPMKVFSNSPSFSYTYANAFLKNKLLCDWLRMKYSEQVRKGPATAKNSANTIGMEKTVYTACLYLQSTGNTNTSKVESIAEKVTSYQKITNSVANQTDVESKYRDVKRQLKEQKEKEKKAGIHDENSEDNSQKTASSEKMKKVTKIPKNKATKKSLSSSKVKKV